MFIHEKFNYDGISSDYFGIYIVRTGTGLISGSYGISRSIIKDKISNNSLPYYFGVEEDVFKFKIQLYIEGEWTIQRRMEIASWLFKGEHKPFYTYDTPEVVYYCMPSGSPSRSFTGTFEGIIEVDFECNAPYPFTQVYQQTFDFSGNNGTQTFILTNHSNITDYKHYPEIEFQLMGDSTGITLTNITDNGNSFVFSGLDIGETIYIDNAKKIIKTSKSGSFRYSSFNKKWLRLLYGENQIQISGKCLIKLRSSFPIII